MTALALAAGLVVVAVVVAALLRRRQRHDPPAQPTWTVPAQLDRADFERPDAPWLVAVFTSATCASCHDMAAKAEVLASRDVAVDVVEVGERPAVHARYRIDAVPLVVMTGDDGVVRASFVGPASATDLWAAMAELREPGSSPEPHLGRPPG